MNLRLATQPYLNLKAAPAVGIEQGRILHPEVLPRVGLKCFRLGNASSGALP